MKRGAPRVGAPMDGTGRAFAASRVGLCSRPMAHRILGLAILLTGCGQVAYDQGQQQAECNETAGGEEGTPDELSELMAELMAPRICEQVTGSFIGLPGEESHEGPEAGRDAAVGRWWIRRCEARVEDDRLRVSIGGPGWTWLDRESTGFRVRQYLRFDGEATFSASFHVGYDARTRIASIWLHPSPGVTAHVEPTGLVQAEATGVFSSLLGGILDMTGSSANDRAQLQAAEEGSQRLQERLAAGFTVTYQLDTAQMDFMLGELPRGQTPLRPWEMGPDGGAWLVNERSAVWPGGMDVVGPIASEQGEVSLDVELEEGDGAEVRRVCEDTLHRWLDAAWNGQRQGPPQGDRIAELRSTGSPRSVRLDTADCRSVLVVTPLSGSSLPAQLRYRVTPVVEAESGAATAQAGGQGPRPGATSSTVVPSGTRGGAVRVEVRSVTVAAENASGGSWDVIGGDPDPYVVVVSIARDGRELARSPVVDDNREARFGLWLPGALRPDDFPIRFVVYDEDTVNDEVIGTADLEASQIPERATDMTLDLRAPGARSGQTGVIRIRLQPER